jgi:hypothetical protein
VKTLLTVMLFSVSAFAADPVLTDSQKLKVRDAQIKVMALQDQLRQTQDAAKKASDDLDAIVKQVTPKGWLLQLDLKLLPEPKATTGKK